MSLKRRFIDNVKNLSGWRTNKKLIVFVVDDYGNIRVHSKKARENMDMKGLKIYSRFDAFDALENEEDLLNLFDVLTSVKDKNGNYAVFTPITLSCNIDFEKMAETKFTEYYYELLPVTFSKLPGYNKVWNLWEEGIRKKIFLPQYHGREHLNLAILMENLVKKDKETLIAFENRSYTSISIPDYTAAFAFRNMEDTKEFPFIIKSGLKAFEQVFGYSAEYFTPPAQQFPLFLESSLPDYGVNFIDKPFYHLNSDNGKNKREFNYTGKKKDDNLLTIVRNVLFEPTDARGIDWVSFTLKQIETAFFWNKPAIISSHRVNFAGHIDPGNRQIGLDALKELLKKIIQYWPEVEFINMSELIDILNSTN